jgi:hypothetical protein
MLGNDTTSLTNNDDSTPTTIHLTSVSTIEQLQYLPLVFLSSKPANTHSNNASNPNNPTSSAMTAYDDRPLVHIDEHGHEYTYYLKPMTQSVLYILLIEMMERFAFYGINYTTTAYLTGEYVQYIYSICVQCVKYIYHVLYASFCDT